MPLQNPPTLLQTAESARREVLNERVLAENKDRRLKGMPTPREARREWGAGTRERSAPSRLCGPALTFPTGGGARDRAERPSSPPGFRFSEGARLTPSDLQHLVLFDRLHLPPAKKNFRRRPILCVPLIVAGVSMPCARQGSQRTHKLGELERVIGDVLSQFDQMLIRTLLHSPSWWGRQPTAVESARKTRHFLRQLHGPNRYSLRRTSPVLRERVVEDAHFDLVGLVNEQHHPRPPLSRPASQSMRPADRVAFRKRTEGGDRFLARRAVYCCPARIPREQLSQW